MEADDISGGPIVKETSQDMLDTSGTDSTNVCVWKGFSSDVQALTFDLFKQHKIKAASLGSQHSLFLTYEGLVFAHGSNDLGQLGQGSLDIKEVASPTLVSEIPSPVTAIACGANHNAAVTCEGRVYCWGSSMEGQCGTGCLDIMPSPTLVPVEINSGFCEHGIPHPAIPVSIKSVACGGSHTLALSSDNEIWAWGAGPQLGLGELMHAPIPRLVDHLKGKVALEVFCGDSHSLALIMSSSKSTPNSSPVKNKNMVAAKSTEVKEDKHYPPKCAVCNNEIYTITESNDTCVIEAVHECRSTQEVNQSAAEEVFTSSGSHTCYDKDKTVNLVEGSVESVIDKENFNLGFSDSQEKLSHENLKEGEVNETCLPSLHKESSSEDSASPAKEQGVLDDPNFINIPACDTSILVITDHNPLETEDIVETARQHEGILGGEEGEGCEKGNQEEEEGEKGNVRNKGGEIRDLSNSRDLGDSLDDVKDITSPDAAEGDVFLPPSSMCVSQGEDQSEELEAASTECEPGDASGRTQKALENALPDYEEPQVKLRPRSASTVSGKSLNLHIQSVSEAMEYLQKQFEDDDKTSEESQKRTEIDVVDGKREKRNLSLNNVLGYSSNVMSQVKSMTSKAWTNFGTLSMFGSSGQLTERPENPQEGGEGQPQDDRTPQSQKMVTSTGSSALSSPAYRDSPDSDTNSSSLARWSHDLSKVDPDPAHAESTGQRSLRTIQMQQRNLSSSRTSTGTSVSEMPVECQPPVVTATEVWVWGKNSHCQLGLGDQVDRALPTELKGFRGRHVTKLAGGLRHSLALNSSSQVFSWGSNAHGQLCQPEDMISPMRVKLSKSYSVWDIAAGAEHSIFLGDSAEMAPEVFYCGKQPSHQSHESCKKTSQLVSVAAVSKMGLINRIAAGGESCVCLASNPPQPDRKLLFELAATERPFYYQLTKTSNLLLRPLQKSAFYTSMDIFPYKSCLENLITAFGTLTKKVGEGIADLTRCIQNQSLVMQVHMVQNHGDFIQAFLHYSQAFSDLLAVGGFDFCTRVGIEFFERVQSSIQDLAQEKDKSVGASKLFLRAMLYPFYRVGAYASYHAKIAEVLHNTHDAAEVQAVSLAWDELKTSLSLEHKTAEATRLFWDTVASKTIVDSLRVPARRLLKESKKSPLHWPSGSRFAQRLFVLFSDIFVLVQNNTMTVLPLETVWVDPSSPEIENPNGFTILAPEERYDLVASTSDQKAQWLLALNSAISRIVTNKKSLPSFHSNEDQVIPPLVRHAKHKFIKSGIYKDAVYQGSWLSGKMDGLGILNFEDGSVYEGQFKRGLMHGPGTRTVVRPADREIQKGNWKDGKLNGYATVSYSNGDLYEGFFQEDQRFGHGCYQSGRHNRASCTSIYVGEWNNNMKDGYGVQDDILKGEKYMGMWVDDQRHGNGVLVTLDGMYFEGNFVQNKLQGFGLMISDDNTMYEGDFMGTTHLSGKGTLTLPTGDKMEGSFNGSLNAGLKVNGTFHKSLSSPDSDHRQSQHTSTKSKYFGRLCVLAENKWKDIFSHTTAALGQNQIRSQGSSTSEKAWEMVAIMVSAGRKALKSDPYISASKVKAQLSLLDSLEKIPACRSGKLHREAVEEIGAYLSKAFDSVHHPLGRLMEFVGEVFRASYIGVGAHPRLLPHAVLEVRSCVNRIYTIVRILFPALPTDGGPKAVYPADPATVAACSKHSKPSLLGRQDSDADDPNILVFTSAGLIYPILLPKIYPPLFDLYALYNERADDMYWERVMKLNRQSDMGLMAYLGVEQRFWLMEDMLKQGASQKLSTVKDVCYAEAVDTLQQLSTAFSPIEKLKVIEQTFNEITKTVSERLSGDVMWCMDDLFPIFQFVVVRAKLQHLGAEIHLVEDLMEAHLEHGEFGIMLTTLKACYFQIQNEKMPHH